MTCKLLFLVLFIIWIVSFSVVEVVPYAAAETDYVEMLDDFRKKDGVTKLFDISGYTSSNFANMTVIFPDESVKTSSISVTSDGYFQTFITLDDRGDPAGLYNVVIHPYNKTEISSTMNASFFLSDYDGMVDIHINRNSVLECNGSSEYCVDPAISHIPKSFAVRFFNDDYNNHQIQIDSVIGDLILPGGDFVMYPKNSGIFEYGCIIHPWINGKLHVSDISSIKYVDDDPLVDLITGFDIANKPQNNISQIQYDVDNCGTCYVGVVTEIIDGDTIYVDKKSVRLALVDTPEKRQTGYADATEFVKESCPIGSRVLIDVDDLHPVDGRGVNFAQVTCGAININEYLMNNGLAKMYHSSCTESEFMYATWTTHNCETPEMIFDTVINKILVSNSSNNFTVPLNVTASVEIIPDDGMGIVYIVVVFIVLLICLVLYMRKNKSSQNTSFTSIEFLE